MCVCMCLCVWCGGCVLGSGPEDWVPGICWGADSRPFLMNRMVQVGLQVPTSLAVRKDLFSWSS